MAFYILWSFVWAQQCWKLNANTSRLADYANMVVYVYDFAIHSHDANIAKKKKEITKFDIGTASVKQCSTMFNCIN